MICLVLIGNIMCNHAREEDHYRIIMINTEASDYLKIILQKIIIKLKYIISYSDLILSGITYCRYFFGVE